MQENPSREQTSTLEKPAISIVRFPLPKLVSFSLHFFLVYAILRFFLVYCIDEQLISPVTLLRFVHNRLTGRKVCLKVWQRNDDELCDSKDPKFLEFLLDGLKFNRKFAPGVYLGVASMKDNDPDEVRAQTVERGLKWSDLKPGERYCLVMKPLNEEWRLDRQLGPDELGTEEGMEFLAQEVVKMHEKLTGVTDELGKPEYLRQKLALNIGLFNRTLDHLEKMACSVEQYRNVSEEMERACQRLMGYFEERYEDGHVKRCHGDLKTTNLWVRPSSMLLSSRRKFCRKLLALDCIDFNPLLYCIDTLSDVAMLAVDMEVRLTDTGCKQRAEGLVGNFLNAYLTRTQENCTQKDFTLAWSLLEYYMTEKAMACAHLFIMYNNLVDLGKKYLDVALRHVEILKRMEFTPLEYRVISLEPETAEMPPYVMVASFYSS